MREDPVERLFLGQRGKKGIEEPKQRTWEQGEEDIEMVRYELCLSDDRLGYAYSGRMTVTEGDKGMEPPNQPASSPRRHSRSDRDVEDDRDEPERGQVTAMIDR